MIAVAAVVCVGVLVFGGLWEREPEYGGKRLSEWVREYSEALDARPAASRQAEQAANAIRHIGSNAVPYLVEWSRYQRPAWRTALEQGLNRGCGLLNSSWRIRVGREKRVKASDAITALIALDGETRQAFPELRKLLLDDPFVQAFLRPPVLTVTLGEIVTNSSRWTADEKHSVAFIIGLAGTNGPSVVPALQRFLVDADSNVRRVATNALRRIGPEALEKATQR